MELLGKCSIEKASTVVHRVVDKVCRHVPLDYKEVSDIWSLEEWWTVTDALDKFSKQFVNVKDDSNVVMSAIECLPGGHQEALLAAVRVRVDDLRSALIDKTTQISQASLSDFDWQLKMVIASDSMSSLDQLLVNVDLHINPTGKTTSVELDQADMSKLVQSLEAANKVLIQMKT